MPTNQNQLKVNNVVDLESFRRVWGVVRGLFTGKRDLYKTFNYNPNPTFDDRFFKYLHQDVAARIIDAPAAALWTNPPLISSINDEWNTLWDDLVAKHSLYNAIERADKLAGIGRYSIILIGFNDGATDLSEPVNTRSLTQKKNKVLFLQPYSERSATIKKFVQDPRSEDFMKPELYTINPMQDNIIGFDSSIHKPGVGNQGFSKGSSLFKGAPTTLTNSFEVHYSRIIHIAENVLENNIYGSPRMERVYNVLDDLLKVTGGSAETFWLTANRGLHVDIDKDLEIDPTDASALASEIDEYENNLRRVIRTRGTKVSSLGSDTPDPTGVFKMLIAVLSGATGIPNRILIGAEAGQLASEQDRANWADRVDERRASWGNPLVIFPIMKKFTNAGYLPADPNNEVTVDWPSAYKMSPLEMAQTSAQHARSATNFAKTFETMENLKRGEPGTPDSVDSMGKVIPGKPAIEGVDLGELVTIDEARKMIGLDKAPITFDSGSDISPTSQQVRIHSRRVQISVGRILSL